METKHLAIEHCELKFNDDEWQVTGYASVFNSVDKVGDTILPGAFEQSLKGGEAIGMHLEHLRWVTPGKWEKFEEDEKGLRAMGYLTRGHSVATDLRASMRHGTIKGLSIGFMIPDGGAERHDDGTRTIKRVDLREVSFTANPAEPKATIESFKSVLDEAQTLRDMESLLRESGSLSKSLATAVVGKMKSLVEQSESVSQRNEALQELKSTMDRYDLRNLINKRSK